MQSSETELLCRQRRQGEDEQSPDGHRWRRSNRTCRPCRRSERGGHLDREEWWEESESKLEIKKKEEKEGLKKDNPSSRSCMRLSILLIASLVPTHFHYPSFWQPLTSLLITFPYCHLYCHPYFHLSTHLLQTLFLFPELIGNSSVSLKHTYSNSGIFLARGDCQYCRAHTHLSTLDQCQ